MKTSWKVFVGVALTLGFGNINAGKASVIAPGAQLQKLVTGFSFTEGPAVDAEGNLYFTDQPNNRIMKIVQGWRTKRIPLSLRSGKRSLLRQGRQSMGMRRRAQRVMANRFKWYCNGRNKKL